MQKWCLRISVLFLAFILLVFAANTIIIDESKDFLFDRLDEVPPKQTALVLGTVKNSRYGGINPYFKYRMEAAADLYHAEKVKEIIVSGDNHIAAYNEPQDMADYLVKLGVPRKVIILDYAGFRTLDSVIRAKKVFNCQSLIIVSQKFHNQRAVYAARNFEIDAVGYNATDIKSHSNYTHYREILSKFLMILDIHFLCTQPKFL
ncbi:MAG: ElyC/SanA/YdcF family protein [Crocinitomicaceae bacterium]